MCASSTWASPRWTETADAELDAAATGAPTASTCIPSGPRAGGGSTGGVVTETSIKACPLSASCRSCSSLTNSPPPGVTNGDCSLLWCQSPIHLEEGSS